MKPNRKLLSYGSVCCQNTHTYVRSYYLHMYVHICVRVCVCMYVCVCVCIYVLCSVVWSGSMDVDEERRTSCANFLNENI